MEKLLNQLENYIPLNEQEEKDKKVIIDFIKNNDDAFLRTNLLGHITASAWVTNKEHTKILLAYHNLYNSWAWLGGHADGETDLMKVAVKEVQEESGIKNVVPINDDILSVETLVVEGHEKRGEYVPCHLHFNVTYLLERDDSETAKVKEDENSAVGWFDIDEAIGKSNEEFFRERIYSKLNYKLKKL